MRLLIATDAWLPQVNGVVTTLKTTGREFAWRSARAAQFESNLVATR